jgi:hypothetical protein
MEARGILRDGEDKIWSENWAFLRALRTSRNVAESDSGSTPLGSTKFIKGLAGNG